jgi:prepilin peptidase CpaA
VTSSVFGVVALAIGFVACVTDVRTRRIPNLLTFGGAVAALVAHGVVGGWSGVGMALAGWVVGCVLFIPFFLLGGMGAGDVKLLAALGAWLGPGEALWLAIYASIAGGIVAVVIAVTKGYLGTALRNVGNLFVYWWLVGPKPMPALTLEKSDAPRLAYAVPIFIGTVATIWLR